VLSTNKRWPSRTRARNVCGRIATLKAEPTGTNVTSRRSNAQTTSVTAWCHGAEWFNFGRLRVDYSEKSIATRKSALEKLRARRRIE
jgi:hypothetical protein